MTEHLTREQYEELRPRLLRQALSNQEMAQVDETTLSLYTEIEHLRETLHFYAQPNWHYPSRDRGKIARAALEQAEVKAIPTSPNPFLSEGAQTAGTCSSQGAVEKPLGVSARPASSESKERSNNE